MANLQVHYAMRAGRLELVDVDGPSASPGTAYTSSQLEIGNFGMYFPTSDGERVCRIHPTISEIWVLPSLTFSWRGDTGTLQGWPCARLTVVKTSNSSHKWCLTNSTMRSLVSDFPRIALPAHDMTEVPAYILPNSHDQNEPGNHTGTHGHSY
jgi:hypothetical protein